MKRINFYLINEETSFDALVFESNGELMPLADRTTPAMAPTTVHSGPTPSPLASVFSTMFGNTSASTKVADKAGLGIVPPQKVVDAYIKTLVAAHVDAAAVIFKMDKIDAEVVLRVAFQKAFQRVLAFPQHPEDVQKSVRDWSGIFADLVAKELPTKITFSSKTIPVLQPDGTTADTIVYAVSQLADPLNPENVVRVIDANASIVDLMSACAHLYLKPEAGWSTK